MRNLEQNELAEALGLHLDTIIGWELYDVLPLPKNISIICDFFDVEPGYFHEYFKVYFDSPEKKLKKWRDKNKLSYNEASTIFDVSYAGFARLLNGKLKLCYKMYLKMKEASVF